MPFRPTAIRKLQCQYGPHYFGPKKRTTERLVVQTTKKRNCPAVIIVREYEVFPQYGLSEESFQALSIFAQRTSRASKLKELSDALQSKQEIEVIKNIMYQYLQTMSTLGTNVVKNQGWLNECIQQCNKK